MSVAPAIIAILMIAAVIWAFLMATNPKHWRLWWMRLIGVPDMTYSKEQKRQQEGQLRFVAWILLLTCAAFAALSIYWAIIEFKESQRVPTDFEQMQDYTRRELEEMKSKKKFRRLD
jgi:hypothetical protein